MINTVRLFALILFITFCFFVNESNALEDRYKIVIEESFYVVKEENKEQFLQIYKSKLFPFWQKMKEKHGLKSL